MEIAVFAVIGVEAIANINVDSIGNDDVDSTHVKPWMCLRKPLAGN
jgi:hypothetical protein